VIGDTVNVAARLESANKAVGTRVLISESTAAQAPGLPMRPVGRLVLKGRSKAIGVFQPVDPADPAAAGLADYRAAYADMAAGRASARQALAELAMQRPADRLVRFHHARLAAGARGDLIELEEK
jgi:adenylate cyclase